LCSVTGWVRSRSARNLLNFSPPWVIMMRSKQWVRDLLKNFVSSRFRRMSSIAKGGASAAHASKFFRLRSSREVFQSGQMVAQVPFSTESASLSVNWPSKIT